MTKEAAVYELASLAQTVLALAKIGPDGLFTFAEELKDEALAKEPSLSNSAWSEQYTQADKWLMEVHVKLER